jgi:ubiquinone/menaquinone biosynthesis C-methylase UbiE
MKDKEDIAKFYDEYSIQQQKMWHNERHYFLLDQLKKNGIKRDSSVLEVGCGIGTMTNLIASLVPDGKIFSTDISAESIEIAKRNNSNFSNIRFWDADSTVVPFPDESFDFILLFDVLEHIQKENRYTFLENISKVMHAKTKFLINVPAPDAHIHAIKHMPELMQIVEEPVFIENIASLLREHQMQIKSFFTYDMWQNEEYQFYLVQKIMPYELNKVTPLEKYNPHSLKNRILRKINKIFK